MNSKKMRMRSHHREEVTHMRINQINNIITRSWRLVLLGLVCCILGSYFYGNHINVYFFHNNNHNFDRSINSLTTPMSLRTNVHEFLQLPQPPSRNQFRTYIPTIATIPMDVNQYWSVLQNYASIHIRGSTVVPYSSTLFSYASSTTTTRNNID